jgi:hypothetical protein
MPLKVRLEGENGDLRQEMVFMPPGSRLELPLPEDPAYRCLGFIDQYGHTVFNWLQMPTLMSEIRRLEEATKDEGARQFLRGFYERAEACREGVHLYLKVLGD